MQEKQKDSFERAHRLYIPRRPASRGRSSYSSKEFERKPTVDGADLLGKKETSRRLPMHLQVFKLRHPLVRLVSVNRLRQSKEV